MLLVVTIHHALCSALKGNSDMLELVLPGSLTREELAYVEEVAKELGLRTEKVSAH